MFASLINILLREGISPTVIKRGHGIMLLETDQLMFLDVINYTSKMSLRKFSKTWCLSNRENQLTKGIFPYRSVII